MAITRVTCPECEAVLRPAKPLSPGKSIKCPKCGAGFVVPDEEEEPAPRPRTKAKPKAASARKAVAKKTSDKVTKKPGKADKAAAPAPKKDQVDDDEEGGSIAYGVAKEEEDEENKPKINYAPDTSIKDLRGPAQAAVIVPTNMVTLAGVLGFIGWLGFLIIILIPILFPLDAESTDKAHPTEALDIFTGLAGASPQGAFSASAPPKEKKEDPSMFIVLGFDLAIFALYPWYLLIVVLMPIFLGLAYSSTLILGAVKTQNLESREWGIVSSIMAMIPYNAGGLLVVLLLVFNLLLNMLFDEQDFINLILIVIASLVYLAQAAAGTWLLVVLMREEVVAGFEYKPE
jgi:hypothetical protein